MLSGASSLRAVSRVPVPSLRGRAAFPVPPLRGRAAFPVPSLRGRAASPVPSLRGSVASTQGESREHPCCVFRCLFVESREYDSSHGASTLRAGLSYRAVPAFALRSVIRYCASWQVLHPPPDPWSCRATRLCAPRPTRPRAPMPRRSPLRRCRTSSRLRPGQHLRPPCALCRRRQLFLRAPPARRA